MISGDKIEYHSLLYSQDSQRAVSSMSSLASPSASPVGLSSRESRSPAALPARQQGRPAQSASIREQAIEKYTALTKHKRDLQRKNKKIQTKIAQHLRKNKIELSASASAGGPVRFGSLQTEPKLRCPLLSRRMPTHHHPSSH